MKMMKKSLMKLFVGFIILASCFPAQREQEPPMPTLTPVLLTATITPTKPSHQYINPLTGLAVKDPQVLERRPVAVKVSNDPRPMRPQWGLSLADIVYEYYTEWGKSRFIAIYYGQDSPMVAPIRSARFFDENIIQMYKAVLAYVGADERVLTRFKKRPYWERIISEWPHGCPPICRYDPKMWNHAFTNTAILSQFFTKLGIDNQRQPLEGMSFSDQPPQHGSAAFIIQVRFSPYTYGEWAYDFLTNNYVRSQDKEDDLGNGEVFEILNDRVTGEVVDADNVVILLVPYEYIVKKEQTEVVNAELLGKGRALLFRDGQVFDVQWKRPSRDAVLHLVDSNGNTVNFKPGRTWFEVMGVTTSIHQLSHGVYRFEFAIP